MQTIKNIRIDNQGPKLTDQDIIGFESEVGSLSDEYVSFLKEYNGGQPVPDCVDVTGLPGSPTDIQIFFGIGRDVETSNLQWIVKNQSDLVGQGFLPIARDSGGSLFCLETGEPNHGNVVYFDMLGDNKSYFVALGFVDFIKSIHSL